jgi:membrane protein DedA with SNARE-associated domain
MHQILQFLIAHGYSILFFWVMAEQIGLPLPSAPMLLAAGALAGAGSMDIRSAVLLAMVAALLADSLWYQLGKRRGARVLTFLCRISLEPDSCVRRTQNVFTKYGARALLVAKFVPGLGAISTPLAGISGVSWPRFLMFDSLGTLLWAGTFTGAGYVFSDRLENVAGYAAGLGMSLSLILFGTPAAYIIWKYIERRRYLHGLRMARIEPEELRSRMESGDSFMIVDLRHSSDFELEPEMVPGAVHMDAEELESATFALPADRDIILYCT